MDAATTFGDDALKAIFHAGAIPNIVDNAASSPLTSLYVSLHTAAPTGDTQTENEVAYTGYARVAVARSSAGWNVSGGVVNPVDPIVFGQMTAGTSQVATHFGIGTAGSGTGKLLYKGKIAPAQAITVGVKPRIDPAAGSSRMVA